MKRIAVLLAAAGSVLVSLIVGASTGRADTNVITIPETAIGPGQQGNTHALARATVGTGSCTGTLTITNNESRNPNNHVTIASGPYSLTFLDVERRQDTVIPWAMPLNGTLDVSVKVGEWGWYSGGLRIDVNCPTTTTTTTTSSTTTSTTVAPTTTVEPSTTTSADTTTTAEATTTVPAPPSSVAAATTLPPPPPVPTISDTLPPTR